MKNSRRKFGFLCLNLKNAKAWGILFYGNVNKMSYTPMKIREMVRHGFKSKIYRIRGQAGTQFMSRTIELIHIGKTFFLLRKMLISSIWF